MMVMLNAEVDIPMTCSDCKRAYIHEIGENPKCRYTKEIMRWYGFDPKKQMKKSTSITQKRLLY